MHEERATDTELVEMYQQGERERAFTAILARYDDLVDRICRANAATPEHAEDARQETFLALHRRLATFEGGEKLGHYLARTAKLTAQDRRGTARRTREVPTATVPFPSTSAWAEDAVIDSMLLTRMLAQLPENERQALVGRHSLGLSRAQLAELLDTTEGYVAVLLHRGRRRARELLVTAQVAGVLLVARARRAWWWGSEHQLAAVAVPAMVLSAGLVLAPALDHGTTVRPTVVAADSTAPRTSATDGGAATTDGPATEHQMATRTTTDSPAPATAGSTDDEWQPDGGHLVGQFVPDTAIPGTDRGIGDRRMEHPDYDYRVQAAGEELVRVEVDDESETEPVFDGTCDELGPTQVASCTRGDG